MAGAHRGLSAWRWPRPTGWAAARQVRRLGYWPRHAGVTWRWLHPFPAVAAAVIWPLALLATSGGPAPVRPAGQT